MEDKELLNEKELECVTGGRKDYSEYLGYHVGTFYKSVNFSVDKKVAYLYKIHKCTTTHCVIVFWYREYIVDSNNHGTLSLDNCDLKAAAFKNRFDTQVSITI